MRAVLIPYTVIRTWIKANISYYCFIGFGIIIIIFLKWEMQVRLQPCLVWELVDVSPVTNVGAAPDTNGI